MLNGLYVLTDSRIHGHSQWPARVEAIIQGGATTIQLREKQLADETLLPLALEIHEVCQSYHVPLIINDRIQLAKKICADGVHIGKSDDALRKVREYLGHEYYIGVSCYRSIYTAIRAQQLGADYVAFGRLFPSHTKHDACGCPLSIIQSAHRYLDIPICGIGGITPNNAARVTRAGASIIAVANTIFNADDPGAVSRQMSGIIRSNQ